MEILRHRRTPEYREYYQAKREYRRAKRRDNREQLMDIVETEAAIVVLSGGALGVLGAISAERPLEAGLTGLGTLAVALLGFKVKGHITERLDSTRDARKIQAKTLFDRYRDLGKAIGEF